MEQSALEHYVMRKVAWRLLPFMGICYVVAFLDRVNVSFAKLSMMADLNLSTAIYATGAGIFFVGYFIFEVPSNLLLERVGARLWIARIMLLWGVISAAMAFVTGKWGFYLMRFLLGASEAGFFPGLVLYNTYWFPRAYRSRTISMCMTAAPFSFVIGGPLSGWLMDHPQFGWKNWQWLFLMEGMPAILLGIAVLLCLPDGPRETKWLKPNEVRWLTSVLDSERAAQEEEKHFTLKEAVLDRKVMLLSLIFFLCVVGGYGVDFFLPTLLQNAYPTLTKSEIGWVSAVPALITIPIMILHGRSADRFKHHRWHVAIASWWLSIGLLVLSFPLPPLLVVAALTLCVSGRWSVVGPFWSLPTAFLTGTAAAGGIAVINSIANLGGQAGPAILASFQSSDGSFAIGLRVLAALVAMCGVVAVLLLPPDRQLPPRQTATC
jgi:ACS family tartrate transporter-like MFS transporter